MQDDTGAKELDSHRPIGADTAGFPGGASGRNRCMTDLGFLRLPATLLLAICSLVACGEQQRPLAGSSAQYLNVEGKRIQVRISPFGSPGEYRLMAVRDAIGFDLDAENERRRGEYAATYYMKQTCVGRGYQLLESGMLDTINYFARFRCNE